MKMWTIIFMTTATCIKLLNFEIWESKVECFVPRKLDFTKFFFQVNSFSEEKLARMTAHKFSRTKIVAKWFSFSLKWNAIQWKLLTYFKVLVLPFAIPTPPVACKFLVRFIFKRQNCTYNIDLYLCLDVILGAQYWIYWHCLTLTSTCSFTEYSYIKTTSSKLPTLIGH